MLEDNKQKCTAIKNITEKYDEHCIDYLRSLECSICRPGHFWNGLNCVQCADLDGCFMCDTLDISICKMCKSGFRMNENGDCVRNKVNLTTLLEGK